MPPPTTASTKSTKDPLPKCKRIVKALFLRHFVNMNAAALIGWPISDGGGHAER